MNVTGSPNDYVSSAFMLLILGSLTTAAYWIYNTGFDFDSYIFFILIRDFDSYIFANFAPKFKFFQFEM